MRFLTSTLLALVLVACGGDDDSGDGGASTAIHNFRVTGTNGANTDSGASVDIDATQNGGVWSLEWDAKAATQPYRADLYVSIDDILSDDDQAFFGRNCDQPFGDCSEPAASFDCRWDSSVSIACAEGVSGDTTNMSNYFAGAAGLPGVYSIILRVCDGLFVDCQTQAKLVRFR